MRTCLKIQVKEQWHSSKSGLVNWESGKFRSRHKHATISLISTFISISLTSPFYLGDKNKKKMYAYKMILMKRTRFSSVQLLLGIVICFVIRNQAEEASFNSRTELVATLPAERSSICWLNEGTKARNRRTR